MDYNNAYEYTWHQITSNRPTQITIPPMEESIYSIDLNTRAISGPKILGVKEDHDAEILYFKVNRYLDLTDLSETVCFVQYETVNKNTGEAYKGLYAIPYYDIETLKDSEEMILVWEIQNLLTQSATSVTYSFRFIRVDDNKKIEYSLNTLTTTSQILNSLDHIDIPIGETSPEADILSQLLQSIKNLESWRSTYWEIVE